MCYLYRRTRPRVNLPVEANFLETCPNDRMLFLVREGFANLYGMFAHYFRLRLTAAATPTRSSDSIPTQP